MRITIEEIDADNISDVNKCDNEFSIYSKLILQLDNDQIRYTTIKVPVTKKRYGIDPIDYNSYINNPDRVVFLAYTENDIAGQIILRKNWNSYANIEDISVDSRVRRQGVGTALVAQARSWAEQRSLPGMMLETQDNNMAACKFYESCGFQLRGLDSYLNKGINPETDEVALFWYLLF